MFGLVYLQDSPGGIIKHSNNTSLISPLNDPATPKRSPLRRPCFARALRSGESASQRRVPAASRRGPVFDFDMNGCRKSL